MGGNIKIKAFKKYKYAKEGYIGVYIILYNIDIFQYRNN